MTGWRDLWGGRACRGSCPRILLIWLLLLAAPAIAEDRRTLGFSRLFSNDALGDQHDRWRTGSYGVSILRGPGWNGTLPAAPGVILEYRARAEIVAPANLASPSPRDRRYAGILSFGVHTHVALGAAEARIGADLVVTGPVTGLSGFQRAVHDLTGLPLPDASDQLGDRVYPMLSGEIGRPFRLTDGATFHPFVEGQVGFETLIRIGADLTIGHFGQGALLIRDTVTGQRVAGIRAPDGGKTGLSLTLGGDVARVEKSALLPEGGAAELRRDRSRLRAGLHWQGNRAEVFYGATWLSPEFVAQAEGQVVGSLQLRLRF
jgi:hypothetical protein